MRSAKANYNRNLIQENIDVWKSFWRAVKRVLPNDKKLKKSVSSIKVDGNLKTDKNAIAKVACEQALHLGDIVDARETRVFTRLASLA